MPVKTIKLVAVLLICFVLTGCFGARETDESAYVMAMGLDKGTKDKLMLTVQIASPKQMGSSGGSPGSGGGGGGGKPFIIVSAEGSSIFTCMNLINTVVSRELSLMHTKVFIYSEDLAKEDLNTYLAPLIRFREVRDSSFILVSKDKAKDFLNQINPELESNPSKYYEQMERVVQFTGFSPLTKIKDFYADLKSYSKEPVAALVGVNKKAKQKDSGQGENQPNNSANSSLGEGKYLPGQVPRTGEQTVEYIGSAIFKGPKLVGELNGSETRYLQMLQGEFREAFFTTLRDPEVQDKSIVINLKQGRKPDITVKNNRIDETIYLEGDIVSIQSGKNYEDPKKMKKLEQVLDSEIKNKCYNLLDKLQNQYQTDSVGYGKYAKHNYLTWNQWIAANWEQQFPDTKINLTVKTKIRRTGFLLKTSSNPQNDR